MFCLSNESAAFSSASTMVVKPVVIVAEDVTRKNSLSILRKSSTSTPAADATRTIVSAASISLAVSVCVAALVEIP